MNQTIDPSHVITQVRHLMKKLDIPKVKLGEVLGKNVKDSIQTKYARANRFLKGQKKGISLEQINQLATFFEKPINFFLYPQKLESGEKCTQDSPPAEKAIREGLMKMGFDQEFIELEIQQLRKFQSYHSPRS